MFLLSKHLDLESIILEAMISPLKFGRIKALSRLYNAQLLFGHLLSRRLEKYTQDVLMDS